MTRIEERVRGNCLVTGLAIALLVLVIAGTSGCKKSPEPTEAPPGPEENAEPTRVTLATPDCPSGELQIDRSPDGRSVKCVAEGTNHGWHIRYRSVSRNLPVAEACLSRLQTIGAPEGDITVICMHSADGTNEGLSVSFVDSMCGNDGPPANLTRAPRLRSLGWSCEGASINPMWTLFWEEMASFGTAGD